MFTVLHRSGGIDNIHSANHVERIGPLAHVGPEGVIIHYGGTDHLPLTLTTGDVFVMNGAGATVASYKLPPPPPCNSQSSGDTASQ